jgi:hypothetical protein
MLFPAFTIRSVSPRLDVLTLCSVLSLTVVSPAAALAQSSALIGSQVVVADAENDVCDSLEQWR